MQKATKKKLTNGLRIITVPMKENPTVTVLVLVGTGSDYEAKEVNGISHFLEHMCFKGTAKRPYSKDISHELDALGCQYNAFTDHEMTGYYAKGDSKNFKQIFDVISDIYLNSTFPEAEMQKEKGVIIEEINMYEDMPQRHVHDLFEEVLYGDQPAGRNIAGTKENVLAMERDDFLRYKKAHYVASGTVIVVCGSVTKEEVYKEVGKHFPSISKNTKGKKPKTKDAQTAPQIKIKFKETDQTHFVLGTRTYPLKDKRNVAISVLSAVLGAGMSSRLFNKLREDMGVAYYVHAYNDTSTDHGSFKISAGVNNSRVQEVVTEILKECKKLTTELVGDKELNKVKSFLAGNTKLSLESTDDIASFYGNQELLKREIHTLEDKLKKLNSITPQEIQNMAKLIFKTKHLNLALIGPFKDKDKKQFKNILRF
jgi:predicted Zn-dependent peptidase